MGTSEPDPSPDDPFLRAWLRTSRSRGRIYEVLAEEPGMNLSELARRLEIHLSSLEYHVDVMAGIGLVEKRDAVRGPETLCFRSEDIGLWEDERTRVLFGSGAVKHVANFLVDHPGRTIREIAEAMDMTSGTVRYSLGLLHEAELVHRRRVGRPYAYAARPVLEAWSEQVGVAYGQPWEDVSAVEEGTSREERREGTGAGECDGLDKGR